MGFDLEQLRAAVAAHGTVTRVVIADVRGSSPREVGASMLVWRGGQSGTIGGGALEYEMARRARTGQTGLSRHALGPELGQCCGGSVQILSEAFEAATIPEPAGGIYARSVSGTAAQPLSVQRSVALARSGTQPIASQLQDGWFIEPLAAPSRALWIWGAGHVGRAIVDALAPLPEFSITWVDTAADRFPETVAQGVTQLPAAAPARLVPHAPETAEHLILTYSHALDLELCHQLLGHSFAFAGLIGSQSKWARFRNRLAALGHSDAQIARIACPIGTPSLGKHPAAIAIGVAHSLLTPSQTAAQRKGLTA